MFQEPRELSLLYIECEKVKVRAAVVSPLVHAEGHTFMWLADPASGQLKCCTHQRSMYFLQFQHLGQ